MCLSPEDCHRRARKHKTVPGILFSDTYGWISELKNPHCPIFSVCLPWKGHSKVIKPKVSNSVLNTVQRWETYGRLITPIQLKLTTQQNPIIRLVNWEVKERSKVQNVLLRGFYLLISVLWLRLTSVFCVSHCDFSNIKIYMLRYV